ncbi:prolyl-tRNA synthetase [Emydomyces testavorans]|uniref:Prolyl-tRNA synthetase n=1 Tax=Emydomyces testavorans TaxID=2070801 RepID=A0AAF0DD14_9EURO|nr:prolyl-tRNA synthetase [Emydomyces testavorans]
MLKAGLLRGISPPSSGSPSSREAGKPDRSTHEIARSGRLNDDSEVFRFYDRRDTPFLLAPTHEEEITTLVAGLVKSYKDLPLRYRDEPRPRQGLLRGREFLMKDLYTFDHSTREAMKTYDLVKETYMRLFDELKLPYIIAAADSGNMGGNLSHEFHFPSSKGEDTVISCSKCNYVFNEELVDGRASESSTKRESERSNPSSGPFGQQEAPAISTGVWTFISKDKRTLVRAYYPKYLLNENTPEPVEREVNPRAVRSIAACHGIDLDLGVKDSLQAWRAEARGIPNTESKGLNVLDIYDFRVRPFDRPPLDDLLRGETAKMVKVQFSSINSYPGTENSLDFIRIQPGDKCPKCGEPALKTDTAIELGHTFHLGTRYSDVLQATVAIDPSKSRESAAANHRANTIVPLQMGCHGIGVSRMISAVADMLADSKGLNWPRVMAPFSVVIIPGKGLEKEAEQVYDAVVSNSVGEIDAILDDRAKDFPWKLGDADLIGFPVILVLGRGWKSEKMVEVQCRRLDGFRTNVSLEELPSVVSSLLKKL